MTHGHSNDTSTSDNGYFTSEPTFYLGQPVGHLMLGDLCVPVREKDAPGRFKRWMLQHLLGIRYETI